MGTVDISCGCEQRLPLLGGGEACKGGLPDLREDPVLYGGDPKRRRSIVVNRFRRKSTGVTTGEPVAALRKCRISCVRAGVLLYQRCSRAFKEICASYAPAMESFSIDEVFLDMTGTHLIYPDPVVAHEIKDKIRMSWALR